MDLIERAATIFVAAGISVMHLHVAAGQAILAGKAGANLLVLFPAEDPREHQSQERFRNGWHGAVTTCSNPEQALAISQALVEGDA